MTWSLTASGHTPTPEGADNWADVEQELHAELHKVLSNPKYGATSSHLSGNHVSGAVHVPATGGHVEAPTAATETSPGEHAHHHPAEHHHHDE